MDNQRIGEDEDQDDYLSDKKKKKRTGKRRLGDEDESKGEKEGASGLIGDEKPVYITHKDK